jgi:putative methyltransferase (TIGR04325 family)
MAAEARKGELERRVTEAEDRKDELERRAAAAEALAHAVTLSTIWRSTTPLRRLVERQPALRLAMRRALSLLAPNLVSTVPPRDEDAQTGQADEGTKGCGTRAAEKRRGEPVDHRPDPSLAAHAPTRPAPSAVPPEAGLAAAEPASAGQLLPEWEHVPEGWRPDDPRTAGWEHSSVIEAQRRKWPAFIRAIQSTNPLGVYHEAAQIDSENPAAHNFVLSFAYVLARAAAGRSSLSVLDWGGGLGHYAVIARATLPEVCVEYTVADLPGICAAGRELLPDVRFTSNAEECLSRRYDLIFASGSLQYAADWRGLLRRFAGSANGWVFLSRTPFVNASAAFVVVQRPHSAEGYRTEYLSRVFNRPQLLTEAMAAGLVLEREFLMVSERVAAVGAPEPFEYRGFLLRPVGRSL